MKEIPVRNLMEFNIDQDLLNDFHKLYEDSSEECQYV